MAGIDVGQRLERFADLVVRVGANVQPGSEVLLQSDIAHQEIARAVVERAYLAGAAWVEVDWRDGPVKRSGVMHASMERLTRTRPWVMEQARNLSEARAVFIALIGDPDPHLLDDADPAKAAAFPVDEHMAIKEMLVGGRHRWTIAAAPNPGWAIEVFGQPDVDRLWDAVTTAMRLDEPDPVAAWRARCGELTARSRALDALELTEVHYQGDGTDLTVGLLPGTRWSGGQHEDPDGIPYMANLPTEEVFASPDRRRAEGEITLTKPVIVNGRIVEGLRAAIERGRITTVTATRNGEAVQAQLETDEGARSLGEVSLVDRHSRIARAGILFHNMLLDENAACHVAWGQGFPFAVAGGLEKSSEELYDLGLNRSAVHTDVVIGGAGLTVTGTGPSGTVDIIRDDEWVLRA